MFQSCYVVVSVFLLINPTETVSLANVFMIKGAILSSGEKVVVAQERMSNNHVRRFRKAASQVSCTTTLLCIYLISPQILMGG